MQREFVANPERAKRAKPARKAIKRATPLKQKSEKQELLDARWDAIKEAFIFLFQKLDPDGPHCEFCGVPGDSKTLDLHHLRRRGQGGEYRARNGALACNRFNVHGDKNCHAKLDGNVLHFGGDDAA